MYLCHLRLQHSDFPDWFLTVAELMMNRLAFLDDYPPANERSQARVVNRVGVGVGWGSGRTTQAE